MLPGCHGPRSGSPAALGLPGLKTQREKGCRTAPHLPWRAVVTCEAAFGIGAVSGAETGTGAPSGEGAAADLMAAGVLG